MIKTYQPNQDIDLNFPSLIWKILRELSESADLGFKFFKRDFLVRYRQSLLGLSWAIIMPILSTALFFLLYQSGVISFGETSIPYIVYVFYGLTVWQLFSSLIISLGSMLPSNKNLMGTIYIPRFATLYSPLLMALTDFTIRVTILFLLMLMTHTPIHFPSMLLACFALIPLILLAIGIGLFLTIVNSITRDLNNVLQTALNFLMFLSPVIYPLKHFGGLLGMIAKLNPLNYLIDFPRGIFFYGHPSESVLYAGMAALSLGVLMAGLRFYYFSISRALEII